jgi:hypothetical protein
MAGQDPCEGPVASSSQQAGKRPKASAEAAAAAVEAAKTAAASHEAAAPPEAAAADMTTAAAPKDPSFLERLPPGICQELVAFVAPSELAALFAASQGTQWLLAAGVRGWRMRGTGCLGKEE